MTPVNVLVVFYSRFGTAEQLALAAGLGAIQAEGSIRLRRLADLAERAEIAASADWTQNLARMNRDYVAPRPADPQWADVVILSTPARSSAEIEQYLSSLTNAGGKIAAPLAPGNTLSALKPVYAAAACAGFFVAPLPEGGDDQMASARAHGRRVVEMARALKERP